MVGRAAIPAGSSPLAVVQVILPGSVLKPRIRGGGGSTDGNGGSRRRGRAGRHGHTGRTGAAGGSVEGDSRRKAKIEARAAERQAAEQAEYEAKRAKREAAKAEGKSPRGPEPKPPESGVGDTDQINLTDEESRIMPAGGNSFQQAYNIQVGVDTESMLIVTEYVTQHANDKQEIEPTLKAIEETAEALGKPEALLSDNGYFSETNVKECAAAGITPYIAPGREPHHLPVEQRWTSPPPLAADANAVETRKCDPRFGC